MKRILFIIVAMSVIAAMPAIAGSAPRGSVGVAMKSVVENEQTRSFIVYAEQATTMSGQLIPLSSPYYVRINGDRMDSHLPYFGRTSNVAFADGEGLVFSGRVEKFKVEETARKGRNVTFEVRTEQDVYKFFIGIDSGGSVEMTVSPGLKQTMSFSGRLGNDTENSLDNKSRQ